MFFFFKAKQCTFSFRDKHYVECDLKYYFLISLTPQRISREKKKIGKCYLA